MRLQVVRLATFISLALRFCFLLLYFQAFYAKKKNHILLLQSEREFVQERKNTAKRQITVEKYL